MPKKILFEADKIKQKNNFNVVRMETAVLGTCTDFCPKNETNLRRKEKLLSRFERSKNVPVKQYSRPAAGQKAPMPNSIRTPETLVKCVKYLIIEVLEPHIVKEADHLELYEFIFDRLRAIRQDLVLQDVQDAVSFYILSVCVRFHLIFGILLADNKSFSSHINTTHQLDCVKACLLLSKSMKPCVNTKMMEAVYILSNIDTPSALHWAVCQSNKSDDLVKSMKIASAYDEENYVKFFRMVSRLPLFLLIACTRYCQIMCDHALSIYVKAYKCKNARYPLSLMADILWLPADRLCNAVLSRGLELKDGHVFLVSNQEMEYAIVDNGLSYLHQMRKIIESNINCISKLLLCNEDVGE